MQGNAAAAQGVLIRLLQIGFATGSVVALGILLLQVQLLHVLPAKLCEPKSTAAFLVYSNVGRGLDPLAV